jgi:hypothetical protein
VTVAVSCNLSEGVILGVDSATTLLAGGNVGKVYENADKLFQLNNSPIGIAVYGLGGLGSRSIGSYLREFEVTKSLSCQKAIPDLVEDLRHFYLDHYMAEIAPALEKQHGKPFDQLTPDQVPALGLIVGGFSPGAYLSEVWNVEIPANRDPGSATRSKGQGEFGTNWFALADPIRRYVKGYDLALMEEVTNYFKTILGRDLAATEIQGIIDIMAKHEYGIPYGAMPMEEGVAHTRFLVQLVIGHHRYAMGAPVVGGKVRIGRVSYRGEPFQIIEG